MAGSPVASRTESGRTSGNRAAAASFERARLALEVIYMYGRVRWLVLRRGSVPAVAILRKGISEQADGAGSLRVRRGLHFGRAVVKVLRFVPADGRCLMRSLVLTGMLARRGVYARVIIGVRPDPGFEAHAWVEVEGQPVLATDETTFRRLVEI